MKFKTLGDWCKWCEKNFSPEIMIPSLPVIIRLDGNNFSNWTKGLDKPYDKNLSQLMIETTQFLVKETNAIVGYTQSDEITLVLYHPDKDGYIYHEGKKQKILSKLTPKLVQFFNNRRGELLPDHNKYAIFDARVFQVPTLTDATLQLLWRENDATKNSKSMLAQSLFSHTSLQNLNGNQLQDKMMLEKGVNWNDMPVHFKRGTYIKRKEICKQFTPDDLSKLPPKHTAHKNPDLIIKRSVIDVIEYPPFGKIKNKTDVIFHDMPVVI